ncbi:hypothetical protein OPV22_027964 [Ensete ventricosum]|uniref:Uncharacterized protein n=1 Tax=Ensete ventricosum TaxID=4639 RepID=A0AAV8PX48_ENSVE|nr:hypothetical protein OPV22_027964 [Ensete ventricosum]RWV95711.1 hypothetical protein GW17_00041643 [Ensete ventricosum]
MTGNGHGFPNSCIGKGVPTNHDLEVACIINRTETSGHSVDINASIDVIEFEEDESGWKCWKHPSQPRYGVCPACLRDHLLRLCPDCNNCLPSSTELARSSGRGGDGAGIVAVGPPVSRPIESEPAFRRSRSVGFQHLRSRSVSNVAPLPRPEGGKRSALLRAFWRVPATEEAADGKLRRSKSVPAVRSRDAGSGEDRGRSKGRRWRFPNPIKAFRNRKSTTKVVQ